jgi:hypothetical protein
MDLVIALGIWQCRISAMSFQTSASRLYFGTHQEKNYNVAWHALMEESPVLTGVPLQWSKRHKFDYVNRHREQIGRKGEIDTQKGLGLGSDLTHCDYKEYFPSRQCKGNMCVGFDFSREKWLLRLAREPSAQEFFMLLRAQLQPHLKNKIALFIEDKFPPDKLVIGIHVRSGNGKDDGQGDFDKKKRGDWLHDLPAAVTMVRKHARMVAFSVMERYNHDLDFEMDGYDSTMDNQFRIFLATDSAAVLDEFRRQDPDILYVEQERMKVGAGVPINEPLKCHNITTSECLIHAEEAMFMDAMIISSCDVALAESFSNWMYTLPATLRLAEGRIFCESGRAALGVRERESIYAPAAWWVHPPPNLMPVRCYHGAWTARDRTNLLAVKDVT